MNKNKHEFGKPIGTLICVYACLFVVLIAARTLADTTTPDFKEVYDLLRTNLGGMDEKTLNHAAVQGLLSQLEGRAVLVGNESDAPGSTNGPSVTSTVYDTQGRVSTTIDALGHRTTTIYDSYGRVSATEDALAQSDSAIRTNLIALYKSLGGGW